MVQKQTHKTELKIMTSRTASAAPANPALDQLRKRGPADAPVALGTARRPQRFEELEGEQSRIRRSSRHWLIG